MIHSDISIYAEIHPMPNVSFHQLKSKSDLIHSGEISYQAHKHRQHIECYDAYNSAEKRTQFATDLRSGKHGKGIDEASLLMSYDGQAVGVIDVVEVPYKDEKIGWIMDISVLPEFQGIGLGQQLIKQSLSNAYYAGYSKIGLGVTLAIRLTNSISI